MNKQTETEIIVLLDKSYSMLKIMRSTVDGFNTFLNEQKGAQGDAYITLVQFDDQYEMNYQGVNVKHIAELIAGDTFAPRGNTALYDAIGRTINNVKTNRDVVFVIITDGEENSSKEFDSNDIKSLITNREKESKWKFLFLGANQDATLAGSNIGIKASNTMTYNTTPESATLMFSSLSSNTVSYRSMKSRGMSMDLSEKSLDFTDQQKEETKNK
jgi:hypothetical protein